jgi:hypothetical protein
MTNQNPASSHPQSSKLDRDILAKVNAHADRSIDRLFVDIDALLGDNPETHDRSSQVERYTPPTQSSAEPSRSTDYTTRQPAQTYLPQADFSSSQQSVEFNPPQPAKKRLPLWMKAFLGIGITSIAASSVLLWLVNERKIELPKNIDTTWLPFQSQSQVSPEDAKFAEYMRKSISKIESAKPQATSATNLPNPANNNITAPIAPNPTGIIATVPTTITPTVVKTPIALIKTLPTSNRPTAIFQIDRHNQTVNVGQKIGTSNWSLLTVAKGEVIVKRKGGEIRSIYVGQKF